MFTQITKISPSVNWLEKITKWSYVKGTSKYISQTFICIFKFVPEIVAKITFLFYWKAIHSAQRIYSARVFWFHQLQKSGYLWTKSKITRVFTMNKPLLYLFTSVILGFYGQILSWKRMDFVLETFLYKRSVNDSWSYSH